MVILSSAQGFTPPYIARLVGYSPDWVRTLIREFNLHGFKMLKPNWKAGGNWKFTQEQKDSLVALATSRPRDLGLPFSQWSLARLRDEARNQRIVDSISLEWLRIVLDEADMSHQSIKTWKESHDPKFEEKRRRIDRLTHQKHNPPIVLSMDEIGPISLQPHGGKGWFRSGHPERIPSTYKRLKGTRYLYLTLNVYHQRLSGRPYRHKGGEPWLDYVQREVEKYPTDQRIYLIQDNLSAHWTPDVPRVGEGQSGDAGGFRHPGELDEPRREPRRRSAEVGAGGVELRVVDRSSERGSASGRLSESRTRTTQEAVWGHSDAQVESPPTTDLETVRGPFSET